MVRFSIRDQRTDIAKADVSAIPDQQYTGSPVEPRPEVFLDGRLLLEGRDYTLSWSDNVGVAGKQHHGAVVVLGMGEYRGRRAVLFRIVPSVGPDQLDIAKADVSPIPDQAYTGRPIYPRPEVRYAGRLLREGVDYTLRYGNNIGGDRESPGRVFVDGVGEYTGTKSVGFNIVPGSTTQRTDIAKASSFIPDQAYTGRPIEPKPEVRYAGRLLREGVDYTLRYENNIGGDRESPGRVFVDGVGEYTGTKSVGFNIVPSRTIGIAKADVSPIPDQAYTGRPVEPRPEVFLDGRLLLEGRDYTLSWSDNVGVAGKQHHGAVVVLGMGEYRGRRAVLFRIVPSVGPDQLDIAKADVSPIPDQQYTGSPVEPRPEVRYAGRLLQEGRDYRLMYLDNDGSADFTREGTVLVYGIGSGGYTGTKKVKFRIVPPSKQKSKIGGGCFFISLHLALFILGPHLLLAMVTGGVSQSYIETWLTVFAILCVPGLLVDLLGTLLDLFLDSRK